jgi:hypothetical protein
LFTSAIPQSQMKNLRGVSATKKEKKGRRGRGRRNP